MIEQDPEGPHQAFGMICWPLLVGRCPVPGQMRNASDDNKLGMTWAKFCEERADISPKCHGDQRRRVRPVRDGVYSQVTWETAYWDRPRSGPLRVNRHSTLFVQQATKFGLAPRAGDTACRRA